MPGVWKLRRRISTGSVGAWLVPMSAAISGRVTAAWSGALHGCLRLKNTTQMWPTSVSHDNNFYRFYSTFIVFPAFLYKTKWNQTIATTYHQISANVDLLLGICTAWTWASFPTLWKYVLPPMGSRRRQNLWNISTSVTLQHPHGANTQGQNQHEQWTTMKV
jgi:hypothetical protein